MRPAMRDSHSRLSEAERITPIWCQVSGMAWQKACTAPSVLGEKRALETKSTPEVPIETKAVPGRDDADAAGGGGVVAGAAGHDHRCPRRPSGAASSGRRSPEGALPSTRRGMWRAGEAGRLEQVVGPVAGADVEPEGAGGVGHLRDVVAGQAAGGRSPWAAARRRCAAKISRLVLAQPGDLRRGEARHGDVAGDLAGAREGGLDLGALGHGAAVVPEDRRAQHLVVVVEADRAVHLAGEADAAQAGEAVLAGERVDGGLDAPATSPRDPARTSRGAGAGRVRRLARLADQPLVAVEEDGLDRGGADVDAEVHGADALRSDGRNRCTSHAKLPLCHWNYCELHLIGSRSLQHDGGLLAEDDHAEDVVLGDVRDLARCRRAGRSSSPRRGRRAPSRRGCRGRSGRCRGPRRFSCSMSSATIWVSLTPSAAVGSSMIRMRALK